MVQRLETMYLTVKQTEQTYALLLKVSLRHKVFEMNDNSISILDNLLLDHVGGGSY